MRIPIVGSVRIGNHKRRPVLSWLLVALLVVGMTSCGGEEEASGKFYCPMHPTYVTDRMGDCPICNMRLVPVPSQKQEQAPSPGDPKTSHNSHAADPSATADPSDANHSVGAGTSPLFVCPMDDGGHSDQPGRCTECGMDLVPAPSATQTSEASPDRAAPGTAPPGMSEVFASPRELALAGVQTESAVLARLAREVRTVGTIEIDESRVRRVQTKVSGWVERLHVNTTGQAVTRGEPILALYSPELLAGQEEYLQARQALAKLADSTLPEARETAALLATAAVRRLELLDVPKQVIAELDRTGTAQRSITLLAPVSGFVTSKSVFEGSAVDPGMELFTVSDLSFVWITAQFYEEDARYVKVGATVEARLPHDPDVRLTGTIAWVSPTLDSETRTLSTRIEMANPGFRLRPGMFADIRLSIAVGDGVVVPSDAILRTGEQDVVFVEVGTGRFVPREVRLGIQSGGRTQILAGVASGERVVTRANFLLDSESRIRAALSGAGHSH